MIHLTTLPLVAAFLTPGSPEEHIEIARGSGPAIERQGEHHLGDLSHPTAAFLGQTVTVIAPFHGQVEGDWDPYLTRFHPAEYRRLRFWDDRQPLWIEGEFDAPVADVFVRRGSFVDSVLQSARTLDRLVLRAAAVELLRGELWVEITDASFAAEQLPEGSIIHASKGIELMERGAWSLAAGELEHALTPLLPAHHRQTLETLRDQAQAKVEAKGEATEAQPSAPRITSGKPRRSRR